jgi:uncharacterized protein
MVRVLPAPTPLTQPYFDGAREHKLLFQRCVRCSEAWHPPMPICPACHSFEFEWVAAAGLGTVYSYTVVHHPTHPAFQDQVPYVVAIVELDEGPRIVANIRNCSVHEVQGGMRVSVLFEDLTDEVTLPQFEPA